MVVNRYKVDLGIGLDRIVPRSAIYPVRTRIAEQDVITSATKDQVVAVSALNIIGIKAAINLIVSIASKDVVWIRRSEQTVIPAATVDIIYARRAADNIISGPAIQIIRIATKADDCNNIITVAAKNVARAKTSAASDQPVVRSAAIGCIFAISRC